LAAATVWAFGVAAAATVAYATPTEPRAAASASAPVIRRRIRERGLRPFVVEGRSVIEVPPSLSSAGGRSLDDIAGHWMR
jgi:hypothetical protein